MNTSAPGAGVVPWTKDGPTRELPKRLVRPCDHGLYGAVVDLEVQLGTVEAYNRLVVAAENLKAKIDSGNAKSQSPIYAVHPRGER